MQRPEVGRLELERWVTGDLDPAREAELEALAVDDSDLRERRDRVRREIAAAALSLPPLVLPDPPSRRWIPVVALGLALGVGLTVALWPRADFGFRGALDIDVQRIRDGRAERQGDEVQARPGDRLQYTVTADRAGWLAVYDLPDDGPIEPWLPPREVGAGETTTGAVILDEHPGAARIVFVLSDAPIADLRTVGERPWVERSIRLVATP